ncbi:unnamed protein product [Acanthoscelides obtectus]|uniref:Uncharacterized protein n=1 Tax=Acanthoscelides obtectus TaxID=200917 RepID=A0A9P0LKF1_ACAOB|nr:unnamed protein product [Acanthoscelides obtectus]CAK1665047.1 hypothetical protein AOBTE_LOCUS24628 [Acanthoscelides obtectus]
MHSKIRSVDFSLSAVVESPSAAELLNWRLS